VLVSARKLADLMVSDGELDEPRQVDRAARRLRAADPPRSAVVAVDPSLPELPERAG
jgi:hypothetical protein